MLCLVSRQMRRLAEPILWRQVAIAWPAQLKRVRACERLASLGCHTRVFVTLGYHCYGSDVPKLFPNLVEMRLSSTWVIPLSQLAKLERALSGETVLAPSADGSVPADLRSLELVSLRISAGAPRRRPFPVFPQLEHLELRWVDLPESTACRWFESASHLPQLRTLVISDCKDRWTVNARLELDDLLCDDLRAQLEAARPPPRAPARPTPAVTGPDASSTPVPATPRVLSPEHIAALRRFFKLPPRAQTASLSPRTAAQHPATSPPASMRRLAPRALPPQVQSRLGRAPLALAATRDREPVQHGTPRPLAQRSPGPARDRGDGTRRGGEGGARGEPGAATATGGASLPPVKPIGARIAARAAARALRTSSGVAPPRL